MITVYRGPQPLALLVRDELLKRGVGADIRTETIMGEPYGVLDTGVPLLGAVAVVVTAEVAESHRAQIDEVLSLVSEGEELPPAEPADEPRHCRPRPPPKGGELALPGCGAGVWKLLGTAEEVPGTVAAHRRNAGITNAALRS